MEALQEENRELRSRLAAQDETSQPQPAPITVHVKAPTPAPRLGIFTGLKPKGGGEVSFSDWTERVRQYLQEVQDADEALRRVRASLRGVVVEQTKDCQTAQNILQSLTNIYGDVQTTEDLYLQFVRLRMEKKELPSDFFSRVWSCFTDLNKEATYTATEAAKKVFHTFMTEAKQFHPMLCLELRNSYGFPGTVSPDPSKVLRRIRELEGGQQSEQLTIKQTTAAAHTTTMPEIDYDKLATLVAQKMLQGSSSQTTPRQGAPRGPCYRCGEIGTHYKRDCPNPANPARVAAAKRQQRLN